MSKIKICHVSVTSKTGGGPEHIYQLLTNSSNSVRNYLVCPEKGGMFGKLHNAINGKWNSLPERSFNFFSFLKFIMFLYKNNINILHSHGFGAGLYCRIAKFFLFNIKLVHTPHGISHELVNKHWYLIYEKFTSLLVNHIIYVSDSEKLFAIKHKLWLSLSNSIVLNGTEIQQPFNKANLKKSKAFTIITASRFDFQKNTLDFCKIAKNLPNMNFIIIGSGKYESECLNFVKLNNLNNIKFLGTISNPLDYYKISDIYLSTARWEGLSMAIIEAFSCGLPVVATNVVGNNDLVINDKNGFLYELDNLSEAINYLQLLDKSKSKYKIISKNNIEEHKIKYSSVIMAKNTVNIYQSLIS